MFLDHFQILGSFQKKFKCIENLPEPLLILLRKKYIFRERERRKIRVNLEIPVEIVA